MKIVLLQGSPNLKGSTNILAEEFTKGAQSAGHSVIRFDITTMNIKSCTGCVACGYEGPCVQKDDNQKIRETILGADMIVFATPLYYYGMSAQLKTVIDRFCAYNSSITRKHMKSALLTVAWNSDSWTFDALEAHYQTLVRYLNLEECGKILGKGCGSPAMTRHSEYVKMAYALGKNLS
ncbi:MAG: flavodoxin family protein [Clostridia bacterium]|nr:flavodoxin family protein [Clostridia bacterium]